MGHSGRCVSKTLTTVLSLKGKDNPVSRKFTVQGRCIGRDRG